MFCLSRHGLAGDAMDDQDGIRLTDNQKKKQRARSIAIAVSIAVLVAIFYALTMLKLGPAVLKRDM
jgi:hypothetical protein